MIEYGPHKKQKTEYNGYWPIKIMGITNVLCQDGRYRKAVITSEPDTYYSIPARVKVHGKTVTGFIVVDDNGVYCFFPDRYRKNAQVIKKEA